MEVSAEKSKWQQRQIRVEKYNVTSIAYLGVIVLADNLKPEVILNNAVAKAEALTKMKLFTETTTYSRTSVARTLMARLPRLYRTRS